MGETYHKYPTMEVAILTVNRPDHDNERACPGDIIVIRRPHHVIGTKEGTEYIWLRFDGLEANGFWDLKGGSGTYMDPQYDAPDAKSFETRYDKRRYCIPLERLKKFIPSFDIARAQDPEDFYQPFITVDFADSGFYKYLCNEAPLTVDGLVFDKDIGDYL